MSVIYHTVGAIGAGGIIDGWPSLLRRQTFSLFQLKGLTTCSVTRLPLEVMGIFSLSCLGALLALSGDVAFFCSDPPILKVKSELSLSAFTSKSPTVLISKGHGVGTRMGSDKSRGPIPVELGD